MGSGSAVYEGLLLRSRRGQNGQLMDTFGVSKNHQTILTVNLQAANGMQVFLREYRRMGGQQLPPIDRRGRLQVIPW